MHAQAGATAAGSGGANLAVFAGLLALLALGAFGVWMYVRKRFPVSADGNP